MNRNNFNSSTDEMKEQIQEDIINLISSKVTSSRIEFWPPETRCLKKEEVEAYPENYNIFVFLDYKKGTKNPAVISKIGFGSMTIINPYFNQIFINLDRKTTQELEIWGKKVARVLSTYFMEKNEFYFVEAKFDLITNQKKEILYIPNVFLENIHFSESIKKAKKKEFISTEEYVSLYTDLSCDFFNYLSDKSG